MAEHESAERVLRHLDGLGLAYEVAEHRAAGTAQDLAAALHVPGAQVAKVVLLFADDRLVMAVLAAPDHVGLIRAREALGAGELRLASESAFAAAFPDCELGAVPPFGDLYGVPTYLDRRLLDAESLIFAAGSHRRSLRLSLAAYRTAARPQIADLAAG